MPPRTSFFKTASLIFFVWTFASCKNAVDIPFPADADEYIAPVTVPIKFGAPQKLTWPENPGNLTSVAGKFDFDKLPVARFDSLGFNSFPKPPEETNFDWNKLPSATFNYDSLLEIPLKFKTSVLPPPEITKVSRPVLKNFKAEIVYDFGDQLNGVEIQSMLKTRDGFTWIAAGKRLYRYDGENLFSYTVDGLSVRKFDMAEDSDGKIWISTPGFGLFVLDLKNGISRQLSSKEGLLSDFTIRVMADHRNRIWATFMPNSFEIGQNITGGSVVIIDQQKKTIKFLQHAQGLSAESPIDLIEDRTQNIWVSTVNAGLNILDLKNNRIKYFGKAHGLNTDTLTSLMEDHAGKIWVSGFFGSLNVIDINKGAIKKFGDQQGFKRSFVGRIIEDSRGNTWIGGDNGVKIIDPSLQLVKSIDQTTGLNADINSQTFEDSRHQILIGSPKGLNIVYKNGHDIYRAGKAQVSTLLADSHGRVWIGTLDKGIQILDTATGLVKLYDREHGLSDDLIQYIVEYNGSILLSTQKGGIEIIDTSLKKIERIGITQGLATANVTSIEKDKENNIWLGGLNKGIDIIDLLHKKIRHIGVTEGLDDSTIIEIKRDAKGLMWFYSQKNGIGIIDIDTKTVRHIIQSEFKPLTGAVEDNLLMHDSRGNTWLVSSANGLFLINSAADSVTRFTFAQGLLTNNITFVREYHGRIYAGSGLGLNIITPPSLTENKKWKIETLGKSDGITKNVRTYNSDLLFNGQYWWGDDGITIINNLDELSNDTIAPATYITGFDIYNHPQYFVNDPWENTDIKDTIWENDRKTLTHYINGQSTAQISELNKEGMLWDSIIATYNLPIGLQLPYNRNYLQFHFAQAHMGTQDTVWYRYILEGVDEEWSEKTNKGSSENYPGMSSGHYTFKVSSLYHGKWSAPVAYSFTINPPWWRTWWAYLLYAIILGGITWSFIQYRSRWLKEENQRLEEMVIQRTNELSQTINELKATQTQLIQSEKMASLGELTAGIAHEIQNPLNFVNNFSEVSVELAAELKEELDKIEIPADKKIALEDIVDDIVKNQEKINHHGKRADSIVKGMLQHSRSSGGAKEPTDINALADEYLRLSYHGLRAKDKSFNATMKTDFDKDLPPVNVIPQDVGRAILNLFTNAFYSVAQKKTLNPNGYEPTVSVTTKKLPGKVEIRVKDNGMGVPQKVLDKIFQPFFTTKPTGQGTGLGLSLGYDIITKGHGGILKVETKEGEGAEFIIQLPL